MKNRISKLVLKFIAGFLLLGALICITSSVVGYQQYKSVIQKQYNDTAYQCAEVALSYVELETIETYVELVKNHRLGIVSEKDLKVHIESEEYVETAERLAALREGMNANDIFFVYVDQEELLSYDGDKENWIPLSYLFDCFTGEDYVLGDVGPINPEFIDEANEILNSGIRSSNYFISESDYGYNTSALLPIKNEEGMVIALLGVEIPMSTIMAALRQYIIYAVLITIVLVIVFIAVYMVYWYQKVIQPINRIATEAAGFIKNENKVSQNLQDIKTKDEIQNLAESILKMQTDINDYIKNITQITAEKERIGAEMNVASNIQLSMLPCIFPAFPEREEFDIFASMNSAKEVGGDFYDFFMVDETHLAIVMADVSGKGVPAALFMVIGKTLIKDHTQPGEDLGEVFTKVNDLLCESNSEGLFITAFEGVLDLVTGEFNYVNAGHEIPFICKAGENFETYKIRPGFVLAGMEGMKYRAGSITLEPGDKIFQYTDGVPEATNANNELYGMERLEKVLNRNKTKTPADILPAIKQDIDAFVGDAPQFDDITMLCLEYKKKGHALNCERNGVQE